jgi:hypothetical protein
MAWNFAFSIGNKVSFWFFGWVLSGYDGMNMRSILPGWNDKELELEWNVMMMM